MEFELPVEAPDDRHRPGPGWLAFFVLVGLLITLQLVAYLDRTPDGERDRDAANADRTVRMMLEQGAAMRQTFGKQAPKDDFRALSRELPKLEAANAGPDSAVVAIGIRRLLGQEPTLDTIQKLSKRKEAKYRTFAELVQNNTPKEEQVRALKSKLPDLFAAELTWALTLEKAGVADARKEVISTERGMRLLGMIFLVVLAGGMGVVAWIAYGVARGSGKLKPVGHPSGELSAPEADRFAGRATQLLAAFFLLPVAIAVLAGENAPKGLGIVFALVMIAIALASFKLPIFGRRLAYAQAGLHRRDFGKGVLWALAALAAEIPVLVILAALSLPLQQFFPAPEHPITVRLAEGADLWMLISTFVSASLMAPIVEEITFRGFVAPAMAKLFKSVAVGLVVAAFCFAAIHPTGVPAWLPLAGVGFMSSLLAYQTGSLWPSIIFHAIHNGVILTVTVAVLG